MSALPYQAGESGRAFVVWIVAAALFLAGCDRSKGSTSASTPPVRIVASIYVIGDIARQIGGPYVKVDSIVESGQSLTDFDLSPDVRQRLGSADLIIAGGQSEPWAIRSLDAPFASDRLVRFDTVGDPSATQPAATADAWLDPERARSVCSELSGRLSGRRPAHDVYFRSESARLSDAIGALASRYATSFKALPASKRHVLALSWEYDALLQRFDIVVDHSVIASAGFLSDAQIRRLNDAAKGGASVVLMPADAVAAQATDLTTRSGLRTVLLDPYGSASVAGRSSYCELLDYDLSQLQQALTQP